MSPMSPQLITSNRTEHLFVHLCQNLFGEDCSLFTKRLVVVPSLPMRAWLQQRMASRDGLGIAAGVDVCLVSQAIQAVEKRLHVEGEESQATPGHLQLSLLLEQKLRQIVNDPTQLETDLWGSLFTFLKVNKAGKLSRRGERRLTGLAVRLATLFGQYGLYGQKMTQEWVEKGEQGWQQQLWSEVFEGAEWGAESEQLERLQTLFAPLPNIQIHLFSMSFLPACQMHFFHALADYCPVTFYQLSPCQRFWTDIRSDRESSYLQTLWQKRGVTEQQQQELDGYLRERNPLLANFGRLGREQALELEEMELESEEVYSLPGAIWSEDVYQEELSHAVESEEAATPLTLLQAVQADLLLLRRPSPNQQIQFPEAEDSVQIHSAPSRWREVEILYHNLLDRMHRSELDIQPNDILVMAPNISEYKPYIEAVFGGHESVIDYQIMDISVSEHNRAVEGLRLLWELALGRWDVTAVVNVLQHPGFQQQQGWSGDDVALIKRWVREGGVRWGGDAAHRDLLLQRDHCQKGMVEQSGVGTWQSGFERLMEGLVTGEGVAVELSDSERLGQVINLFRSMWNDLKLLVDGTTMTIGNWALYLRCLMEAYFGVHAAEERGDRAVLESQLDQLQRAGEGTKEYCFPFATVKAHLEQIFERTTLTLRENRVQAVRFCSMLPMRAIPAKVVALLGMEEEAFPRKEDLQGMSLLAGREDVDYVPSRTDFDRYLFLEAILSARGYLLVSYQGGTEGAKPVSSLVVNELLHMFSEGYLIGENDPSNVLVIQHPFFSYDPSYFQRQHGLCNYRLRDYRLARTATEKRDLMKPRFIVDRERLDLKELPLFETTIDLRDLNLLARNPLRFYLTHRLGIWLREEEELENEEMLTLSPLERFLQVKEAVIQGTIAKPQLPLGLFKEVAVHQLATEVADWSKHLATMNVSVNELFHVELHPHCDRAEQVSEGQWVVPAVKVELSDRTVQLVGTLSDLTSSGMVHFGRLRWTDVARVWPRFLAMQTLPEEMTAGQLLCVRDGKVGNSFVKDPTELLQGYLNHFMKALEQPSLLLPEIIPQLLQEKPVDLASLVHDPFAGIYSNELDWLVRHGGVEVPVETKGDVEQLFGVVGKEWSLGKV